VLETEGEVENEIVKTDENGYVTVKWKAKSQQDKLIAKLVDKAGETINQAEFAPAIQNNISVNIKDTQGQLGGHATFVLETRADLPDNVQLSNTGIYVLKDDGTYSLIPAAMKQGNSFISTFMLEENAKDMTVDYQNFTASKEIQIGTFTSATCLIPGGPIDEVKITLGIRTTDPIPYLISDDAGCFISTGSGREGRAASEGRRNTESTSDGICGTGKKTDRTAEKTGKHKKDHCSGTDTAWPGRRNQKSTGRTVGKRNCGGAKNDCFYGEKESCAKKGSGGERGQKLPG
jgi:hypothetical protein